MQENIKELNIQIAEIEEMITHFIMLKEMNPGLEIYIDELAYWRKSLQYVKKLKRERLANT